MPWTSRNTMRLLLLLSFSSLAAWAQPFFFGVEVGTPVTDFFSGSGTAQFPYSSITNRYLIGPTAELRLPLGFAVEFEALYRHYSYYSPGFRVLEPPIIQLQDGLEQATGGAWEFPLLAKYHLPTKWVKPYLDGGVAWNRISGLSALVCSINCGTTTRAPSLENGAVTGAVAGAGIDIPLFFLHLSPEVRYTRWGARQFQSPNGGFGSRQDQVEILLGITY